MLPIPHVMSLSDYLQIAEQATVIELPLADELDSALIFFAQRWYLVINANYDSVQPKSNPIVEEEAS